MSQHQAITGVLSIDPIFYSQRGKSSVWLTIQRRPIPLRVGLHNAYLADKCRGLHAGDTVTITMQEYAGATDTVNCWYGQIKRSNRDD